MNRLVAVTQTTDIFRHYRNTPVQTLFEYHNLNKEFDTYLDAQILIGMCMDNRKSLNIPVNFAYIIRTGGANIQDRDFNISYAIAIGKIRYIVLIGHNNCGMVGLNSRKEAFVEGMIEGAGWTRNKAEEHFTQLAPVSEIGNEVDFTLNQVKRLRNMYPKITVAPLLYKVEDGRLYLISE